MRNRPFFVICRLLMLALAAALLITPPPCGAHAAAPTFTDGMIVVARVALRDNAALSAPAVITLTRGQRVTILSHDDGVLHVRALPGEQEGYVSESAVAPLRADALFIAKVPHRVIQSKTYAGKPAELEETLIDVREVIPDLDIQMIFATPDNVMGEPLYPRDLCLLQEGTARRLKRAEDMFREMGYHMRVYDAYRPARVQRILFDKIRNASYIANPDNKGSMHNRGAAVDIALVDADGNLLEMPTPMHTFTAAAHRNAKMSAAARKNMNLMTKVMRQCGFATISSEWWHFTDNHEKDRPLTDYDFGALEVVEAE